VARRRRTPEQAREEILDAAEALLRVEGPDALKIARVARQAGMSHPGLLHHFPSAGALAEGLHQRVSRSIRQDLVALLETEGDRSEALERVAAQLADPAKGRLLAWVLASGRDPFPPSDEQGLADVAGRLAAPGADPDVVAHKVALVVLAMLGDSLMGAAVRQRLGLADDAAGTFRAWVLDVVLTA
jgi:AcrR family transcriptional regulator